MQNLTRASEELFRRGPDECFATFDALWQHDVGHGGPTLQRERPGRPTLDTPRLREAKQATT